MSRILLTAAGLLLLSLASTAAPIAKAKPIHKPVSLVCPVTGETIASIKDAAGSSVYKGKTYYFCCSSCKPTFDANPAKYVKSATAH